MFSILKNIILISQIDIIKQTQKTSLPVVLYINDLCIKNIKIIYFLNESVFNLSDWSISLKLGSSWAGLQGSNRDVETSTAPLQGSFMVIMCREGINDHQP